MLQGDAGGEPGAGCGLRSWISHVPPDLRDTAGLDNDAVRGTRTQVSGRKILWLGV